MQGDLSSDDDVDEYQEGLGTSKKRENSDDESETGSPIKQLSKEYFLKKIFYSTIEEQVFLKRLR